MTAKEIEIGKWYHLSGDIANGYMNGMRQKVFNQ